MNTSTKQAYSTFISANPYKGDWYVGALNTLSTTTSPSYSKEQYAISFLNTKGFISTLVGISKNIPDEDIHDALVNKTYEELALDMAVEYHVRFIKASHQGSESENFYHVFVVDPLTLEHDYAEVIDAIKYIDCIVPAPLLLKSLYVKELIDAAGVHCFIYFQENDAFFCIYNEQEYVYAKSLKFSLKQMHERFCELAGEQIDLGAFETMLSAKGLGASNPEHQKNLIKLFGEIFLHVSDIMTYAKRAYDIKRVDTIYIGTSLGAIAGLDEYTQAYLGIKTLPFDFDYGFETKGIPVSQIHQLMQLYGRLEPEERYDCNFTIFHRPPPFARRDSGKFILATAASLAAALLYPGIYWTLSYAEEFRHAYLSKEYEQVHRDKTTREETINLKLANQKAAQALLDEQMNAYRQKQETLTQVHEKKVDYPMKAKIMADFTRSFNQYRVQLTSTSYGEDQNGSTKTFSFGLTSPSTQNITALLKHLTDVKHEAYDFDLKLIAYDSEQKAYLGELKAVIK